MVADAILMGGAERLVIIHTVVAVGDRIAVLTAIPDLDDPTTLAFFTPMSAAATPAPAPPAG
jgi:hypothetical protein